MSRFCDCGHKATWVYMPSYSGPQVNDYYCDNCVPRGCSCNTEPEDGDYDNLDPANWVQALDEQGRELPCCEYFIIED